MKPYLLENEELKVLSAKIGGWRIMTNHIEREFNFSNFIEAFSFMTKIALICEKHNPVSYTHLTLPTICSV